MSQVLKPIVDGISCPRLVGLGKSPGLIRSTSIVWPVTDLRSVLPGEWVESSQLDPTSAHLVLAALPEEATGVGSNERDSEHVEAHDASNRVVHMSPLSVVVTKPVLDVLP